MRRLGLFLFIFLALTTLTHCNKTTEKRASNEIRIGTIAGPETELMEVAKNVAAQKYHLKLTIVPFTDYVLPNQALADGSIDANMFQHLPYLLETTSAKGYKLVPIGKTYIYPMGIYSNKITKLTDLKDNSVVAIPNDPSNEARALLLLEQAQIIKLKPSTDMKANLRATTADIIENPKNIKIKELDAAQLPRVLADVDLAAINTNYAMVAGLVPSRDALILESKDSPYANIVVVRTEDKDDPKYKQMLMDALHSPEVQTKANSLFQGQAIPAWDTSNVDAAATSSVEKK